MNALGIFVRGMAVLAVLIVWPAMGRAQTAANSGQVVGQVMDSSAAAIVDAEITVRSLNTNQVRRTKTDDAGRYAVTQLPLGSYEVTATGPGFQPFVQEVVVTMGASSSVNFKMAVAGIVEDVAVTANRVDTGTHAAKAVLTALQVQNLPASGRRVRSMFQLTPGTQIEPECGGFAVSGQKGTFINLNVDGGDCTNTHWTGHLEFSPTIGLEALQEMQVLRGTFSAEFGRSTGGIVNLFDPLGQQPADRYQLLPVPERRADEDRRVRPHADRRGTTVRRLPRRAAEEGPHVLLRLARVSSEHEAGRNPVLGAGHSEPARSPGGARAAWGRA